MVAPVAQASLDDVLEARNKGIEKAERGTDPEWGNRALEVVKAIAKNNVTFTADAVWEALGPDTPRETRALGPILNRAQRLGWIVKSPQTVMSQRPVNHGREIRVWKSNFK